MDYRVMPDVIKTGQDVRANTHWQNNYCKAARAATVVTIPGGRI